MPEEALFTYAIPVAMLVGGVLLLPLVRALARRIDVPARTAHLPSAVEERLGRIETAVDAIAVEVERIAEAQRFSSRLLADVASSIERRELGRGPAPERNPPPESRGVPRLPS